jgi:prepilin-type processing-associated H-X9-DG protein
LIELLVVIATISVLLAILLPCINRARMIAKRLVCQSNLRQIAHAWNLYLEDNDGYFFQKIRNANLEYGGWQGEYQREMEIPPSARPLNPYLGLPLVDMNESKAKVFCCPADRGGAADYYPHIKAYHWRGTSYSTNIMLIGQDELLSQTIPPGAIRDLHLAVNQKLDKINWKQVSNPTRLLLLGDYGWLNQWKPITIPPEFKELAEWHQRVDSHNMAFLDGHVKFLTIEKGLYIGDEYTVIPFKELYGMARAAQGESP